MKILDDHTQRELSGEEVNAVLAQARLVTQRLGKEEFGLVALWETDGDPFVQMASARIRGINCEKDEQTRARKVRKCLRNVMEARVKHPRFRAQFRYHLRQRDHSIEALETNP